MYDDWFAGASDASGPARFLAGCEGPVLELGVGTGRVATELAAAGHDVVGLDASFAMIREWRRKGDATAVVADMARLPFRPAGRFSVVLIAYNTLFNLTSRSDQVACIRDAGRVLARGGRTVVEAFVPPVLGPSRDVIEVRDVRPERVVLNIASHDPGEQMMYGRYVEFAPGSVTTRPWRVRYATPEQLDSMASEAGLALVERFADWDRAPFSPETSAMHVSVYAPR